ncbi:MAG: hypothetical protein NVSMB24_16410 [Mucilaginibacter sp.]
MVGANYPHHTFDDGDEIKFGRIKLKAINTPGHSPDSICVVLEHDGKDKAVFTGDTLFIGDCGRPDLRETAGAITAKRQELAKSMYNSLRSKLMLLDNDVIVYPAHGAGTLCGKGLSDASSSTIGAEKLSNWSLQLMSEAAFTATLLEDQPFIPKYFPYNVKLNKTGAKTLAKALAEIRYGRPAIMTKNILTVDTRPETAYKRSHLQGSVNLQNGAKFETWLGSIIAPGEAFYLVAKNTEILEELVMRCAKIGYERFIEQAFVFEGGDEIMEAIDIQKFSASMQDYTIVDIRNPNEVKTSPIFENAIEIPLPELRERGNEIPNNKPVVVHCAGGYRSAAGSSLLQNRFDGHPKVYDLGEFIKIFNN